MAITGANTILAVRGTFALLVWFNSIYYYAWTGERLFDSLLGIAVYYVFPLKVATLLFAFLQGKSSLKVNVAVCWLALTASLYMGELFLTPRGEEIAIQWFSKGKADVAKQFEVKCDIRSWFEIITELRKENVDAGLRLLCVF